jgi:hypothetical protein
MHGVVKKVEEPTPATTSPAIESCDDENERWLMQNMTSASHCQPEEVNEVVSGKERLEQLCLEKELRFDVE